jgi:hypothetical protein
MMQRGSGGHGRHRRADEEAKAVVTVRVTSIAAKARRYLGWIRHGSSYGRPGLRHASRARFRHRQRRVGAGARACSGNRSSSSGGE